MSNLPNSKNYSKTDYPEKILTNNWLLENRFSVGPNKVNCLRSLDKFFDPCQNFVYKKVTGVSTVHNSVSFLKIVLELTGRHSMTKRRIAA